MTRNILAFVHQDFEELELLYPKYRLIEAGFDVVIAGPKENELYQGKHGYPCTSSAKIQSINVKEFDALVIPGGYAPDRLRRDPYVLQIVQEFHRQEKVIAYICHAGWVPISANVVRGFRCTSTPAIKDDLVNAGAIWEDAPVVVDRHHISSRHPDDLPYFCRELICCLER